MSDQDEQKWVDYSEDKARYNQQCVKVWRGWFDEFEDRIVENTQLCNNYSEDLAERKKDETLSRSCLFIPIINPAVLSRTAYVARQVFSVKEPIEPVATGGTSPQIAENVKNLIHDVLKKDKYPLTFIEQMLAQEQYPVAFLKVCEFEEEEKVVSIEPDYFKDEFGIPIVGDEFKLTDVKTWKSQKKQWRPKIELFTQESVFYDPDAPNWDNLKFIGTITALTLGEIVDRKSSMGYKFDLDELKSKGQYIDESENDFIERIRTSSEQESKRDTTGKPQKYKVVENFHKVEKPNGETKNTITVTCGDVVLKDVDYPYQKLSIPDPFIRLIGYPVLNQIEGMTTTDLMKHLQHGTNDFFNMLMDHGRYGLFPPIMKDTRAQICNDTVITTGAIWDVDFKGSPNLTLDNSFKQLYNVSPVNRDFFAIIDALLERAELVGNAPEDIFMSGKTDPDEKLGQTKLRAGAASGRMAGITILMIVEILKSLGRIIWGMTLDRLSVNDKYKIDMGVDDQGEMQSLGLGINDINGTLDFDVPHLSGLAEREMKSGKLEKLFAMVMNMPFVGHPAMLPVIYSFLRKQAEYSLVLPEFEEVFPAGVVEMLQIPVMPPGGPGGGSSPPKKAGSDNSLLDQINQSLGGM